MDVGVSLVSQQAAGREQTRPLTWSHLDRDRELRLPHDEVVVVIETIPSCGGATPQVRMGGCLPSTPRGWVGSTKTVWVLTASRGEPLSFSVEPPLSPRHRSPHRSPHRALREVHLRTCRAPQTRSRTCKDHPWQPRHWNPIARVAPRHAPRVHAYPSMSRASPKAYFLPASSQRYPAVAVLYARAVAFGPAPGVAH